MKRAAAVKPSSRFLRATLLTTAAALLLSIFWFLLVFGTALLCCSPILPNLSFWTYEKLFYGFVPICAAIIVVIVSFRLLTLAYAGRIIACFVAIPLVVLSIAGDVIIYQRARFSADDHISLRWDAGSGVFAWGLGMTALPPGSTHERLTGHDTFVGNFKSEDRQFVISYDIGELASEHGGIGDRESQVRGSRIRIGSGLRRDDEGRMLYFRKVTFVDNGCANFYAESDDERRLAAIDFIASSFQPAGRTPAWIRRLLPEFLRSDCRYRFTLPERIEALF